MLPEGKVITKALESQHAYTRELSTESALICLGVIF